MTSPESIANFATAFVLGRPEPLVIGVDPGATGAVALLCSGAVAVFDIPTLSVERKGSTKARPLHRTEFSLPEIVRLFGELDVVPKARIRIGLEHAQVQIAGKGANAYTAFRVGCSFGMWPLFFAEKGWSYVTYQPSVWKKAMDLTKDKEHARQVAQRMYPNAPLERKKDEGRAHALLLAEFHRRRLSGDR